MKRTFMAMHCVLCARFDEIYSKHAAIKLCITKVLHSQIHIRKRSKEETCVLLKNVYIKQNKNKNKINKKKE